MLEMQTRFFNALWGDASGNRSIWYGKKGKSPSNQKWFASNELAIGFANRLSNAKTYNVFHACSVFLDIKRQQQSVASVKALWVDIDLKDSPCTSIKELATKYLPLYREFKLGTNFWVVLSGHGLHLYWIFETAISPEDWSYLAAELHSYNKEYDIPVDSSRTRDSASLLRVPWSWNIKDTPVQVKILREGTPIKLNLSRKSTLPKKATRTKKKDLKLNQKLQLTYDTQNDPYAIAEKCQAIGQFKETALEGNEPARYKAISVLRLCKDGDDVIHEFFSSHSRYTKEAAQQKIAQLKAKDIGPALCDSFAECGVCKGCPHKGKIASPIQLGIIVEPIKKPLEEMQSEKAKERAEEFLELAPKKKWLIGEKGIYKVIESIPVCVSHIPFYITDKFSEDANDQSVVTILIRAFTPLGPITFRVPLKYMADDKKLMGEFNSRGIFPANKKQFKQYLMDYCNNLSHIKPHEAANSLGWQPNGSFIYSSQGEGYDKKGEPTTSIVDANATSYAAGFSSKGTMKKWGEVITIYGQHLHFKPHLFSVLCSLGAPLLPFTSAKGFVLSLQGQSGCGKTLSHMYASSVWGQPQTAGCIGTKDTNVSMLGRLGAVKNMPLRLDEATTLSTTMLSGLIYELVNGRGRSRAKKDGSLSGSSTEWQTITMITTNSPLLEHKIADISEAARYRILELDVQMPSEMMQVGKKIGTIMEKNYGLCGKLFMQWVVTNQEETGKLLEQYFEKFQKLVSADKRYWVACGAVAFTAAGIGNKLNLFNVSLDDLHTWFVDILNNQATINEQFIVDTRGFDTLDEFVHALKDYVTGHILRLGEDNTELPPIPHGEVKARIKYSGDGTTLYVRAPTLTEFIKRHFTESVKSVRSRLGISDSQTFRSGSLVGRYYEFSL